VTGRRSSAARPWTGACAPGRVLAIRLQALGDVTITLPYLQALQRLHGRPEVDFLTLAEASELPRSIVLFRHVYALGGGRSVKQQLALALLAVPRLWVQGYDVVLDLQNNVVSRAVRTLLRPAAWSEFDRESPRSAGERTRTTIEAAGFSLPQVEARLTLKTPDAVLDILREAGWDESRELVVLSPAGAFPSRNWPLECYSTFAQKWRRRRPAQFAVLGLQSISAKAEALRAKIGLDLLNLAGKTTASEALAILQRARLILSEDCGLMHMAWVSGVPTLALFGSSRYDWSSPLGAHTLCLHSGDLPCGACMDRDCRFGDVRCLTRYTPDFVVEQGEALLARAPQVRLCHPVA
jgi:ADP-heptose:LPS heptosyltransferase